MDKKNDATSEENVKFCVKDGIRLLHVVGQKDQTLLDAMSDNEKNLGTSNYILFADVKEHHGKVVVPPTLLCGWLQEVDAIIEREKISNLKKTGSPMAGHQTNLPKFEHQTIFFIKMDDRKNKQSITTICYNDYKCKDLCVIANDSATFLEALKDDGRFTNAEHFQLQNNGKSTAINLQAKHFPNEVFSVSAKRSGNRKRKADPTSDSKAESKRIALGDCTNTASGGIESDGVIKKEHPNNIPTSFSESVTEDMYQVVVQKVKSNAYELFLGPSKAKDKKTRDKAICDLVKKQLSKTVDQSKPAWLIERIAFATKLVGRIFCGNTTGTCFLVAKSIVMTNLHVYHDIQKEIRNSGLPDTQKKAAVRFNDKYPNQVENLVEVEVQIDEVIDQSSDLDYVLLRLNNHNHMHLHRAQVKLCDMVFKNVDQADGLVTIIGHPGGQPKAVDTDCRIVSEYLWRNQVQKRVQKIVGFDSYFYLSTIKEETASDEYEHKLAYDTSFFEGASGSPVFNDDGLVVAMHTCCYKIDKMGPNAIAVMEFGVSMTAIFNDLYQKNPSLATKLFPHYQLPMDISHD